MESRSKKLELLKNCISILEYNINNYELTKDKQKLLSQDDMFCIYFEAVRPHMMLTEEESKEIDGTDELAEFCNLEIKLDYSMWKFFSIVNIVNGLDHLNKPWDNYSHN